jgi:tetratricopeptide (TPR) repeat protein
MRNLTVTAVFGICLALVAGGGGPESRKPLREARSDNRRFVLTIDVRNDARTPASQPAEAPAKTPESQPAAETETPTSQPGAKRAAERSGPPATLSEVRGRERTERWRSRLVNEVGPGIACIRDDGRFVVTLDEHAVGGAKHAVVIYDERGELVREFALRELLTRSDWERVRSRGNYVEWLRGARFRFKDGPERFVIRLRHGREIEISLERFELLRTRGAEALAGDAELPPELAAALAGKATQEDVFGEEDEDAQAALTDSIDALREQLLLDEMRLIELESPDSGATAEEIEAARQAFVATSERLQLLEAAKAFDSTGSSEGDPGVAGSSAAFGVPVPRPSAEEPVNYLKWYNEMSVPRGPNAAPFYEKAFAGLGEWDSESETFQNAMNGDLDALKSDEVQIWLESNRESIGLIKQANQMDFAGFGNAPEEGRLFEVLLPNAAKSRAAARDMVLEGRLREAEGDFAGAMDEYMHALRLGGQVSQAPTLIENLTGIASQTIAADALLDSFETAGDNMDYVALAERLRDQYIPTRPMVETLQFERAMALDVLQSAFERNPEDGSVRLSPAGLANLAELLGSTGPDAPDPAALAEQLGRVGMDAVADHLNRFYDRASQASALPHAEAQAALLRLEEEISTPEFRAANPLPAVLLPAFSRAAAIANRNESQRRATLLMAEIMSSRQHLGRVPESLDEFGDRAIDPLTGRPFVYRATPDGGFTLYSLGFNNTDEGGVHDPRRNDNDMVYWPRPKNPR